ncbi:MAG TPA: NAD(P)H-hydrate dehydratase [Clostridiaceae bacterium]|nr:NAD(P)H-hydrate dehydratase [Clostridiaceae bacterium]
MKVVKPEEMAKIDKTAIEEYGIPGIVLMENAALSVVEEIKNTLGSISDKRVIVFAGKGNNGGDALAVARHLHNRGAYVNIYIVGDANAIMGDAKINLDIVRKIGLKPVELKGEQINSDFNYISNMMLYINEADMIVDGILGTGLKGEVTGLVSDVIKIINESGKFVLSIDIPSGLNGSTGQVMGVCVKADKTVTFGLPKVGLLLHPGCEYAGEIIVADIGIPHEIIHIMNLKNNIVDFDIFSSLIPKRPKETNKGDYGRVLIITGAPGMTGAGCLAAKAALRTGAGLVYLGVPSTLAHIYDINVTEAITISMKDMDFSDKSNEDNYQKEEYRYLNEVHCPSKRTGYLSSSNISMLGEYIKNKDVIAVGPGLSVKGGVFDITAWLIENSQVPLVLDADALNVISRDVSILGKLKTKAVVTPHPGEMARLTNLSIEEIQANRVETARNFACRWGVVTVLKGWRTIVGLPDGTIFINTSGNPGMATAGTGDVLTGIIAGLIAQGLTPEQAAVAGVFLHGNAGDRVASRIGEHGLIAGDLVEEIPYVIKAGRDRNNGIQIK